MLHKPEIILASASPRRELLLREMGFAFKVIQPTGVAEATNGFAPDVLVMHNAQQKARAVAAQHRESLVIGADTEVVLDDVVFGKPADLAAAESMLAKLAGRRHDVFTGVCVIHLPMELELTFAERTGVTMRPLMPAQIRDYFTKVTPLDKSGAYGAQEFGELIIERVEGSFSNVMGLPVERLRATFEKLGLA
ncbi:MAG: Maf family protein [Verrucomicrobiota bacterium]